jgi:hypothetical protein
MSNPEKPTVPESPVFLGPEEVRAELRDAGGQVIAKGSAFFPPRKDIVLFFPQPALALDKPLAHAAILFLTDTGKQISIVGPGTCPDKIQRQHFHFRLLA